MKRSCQRHTQVFDLPVRRMISLVPKPSALNRTISARQTCLCGALRSRARAFRRRRSAGLRVIDIPVRMRQTRMHPVRWESPPGFKCQTRSTRLYAWGAPVTLADICLVPQVANARRFKVPLDKFPKIVAVDAVCLKLPAFNKARPENQPDAE